MNGGIDKKGLTDCQNIVKYKLKMFLRLISHEAKKFFVYIQILLTNLIFKEKKRERKIRTN
ncbi:MAG: hypothetical protein ATN35_10610 [Epulopiscium sp. Nele67-Bin004]|nr:MAG: hypothetical protein ATN35_10610 [Epulopiscium sp. Nele67-Bin004]